MEKLLPHLLFKRTRLWVTLSLVLLNLVAWAQQPFITTWKTDNTGASNPNQISIPATGDFNYIWENVANSAEKGSGNGSGTTTITFPQAGTYQLSIQPTGGMPFRRIAFYQTSNDDKLKIIAINNWGTIPWSSFVFNGCSNLKITATDIPNLSGVTDLSFGFSKSGIESIPNINDWDVSNVTDLSSFLQGVTGFNQSLSNWDVSHVTNMSFMFDGAASFNQPLDSWDVRKLENLDYMFRGASSFNQSLGAWNLESFVGAVGVLDRSGMSCENYSYTLYGWATNPNTNNGAIFHPWGTIEYSPAVVPYRDFLINNLGWNISDDALGTCSITLPNHAPTVSGLPASIEITEDIRGNLDIASSTFADADNDEITVSLSVSDGTIALAATGGRPVVLGGNASSTITVTGTPDAVNGYLGTSSNTIYIPPTNLNGSPAAILTVSVNDGSGDVELGTVPINIMAVNDAPVAVNDTITVTENIPATGNVLTNDMDPEGDTMTASLVTAPVNGTVVLNADGSFTYTPNANYSGLDSLTYQTCDNGTPSLCDTALARFTVNAVNDAPIAVDDEVTVQQNTPATGNVLTNDNDPDGNALTASLVTAPVNGTIVLNANGSFTYMPNASYSGLDSLEYQTCDNGTPSLCDTAWVHFSITAVAAPHCGWATAQVSGTTVGCVLCSVTNPSQAIDGDKDSYSSLNIPVGLSGGEVFQRLDFAAAATTYDAFRVGISTDHPLTDASSLVGLTLTFYHDDTQVAQYNDVTTFALDPVGDGNPAELYVVPGVVFNRVKIALVAANGNINTVRIHDARIAPPIAEVDHTQIDIYGSGTATFTITDPKPGMTYKWYSESDELLDTGLDFTTPALSANTTYYVATMNAAGCEVRIPVAVRVLPLASPEVTTSGGTTTFTESVDGNPIPVAIDNGLTVSDADNTTLASANITITGNFQNGEDLLAFANDGSTMGDIGGYYDDATGILTLTSAGATATLAQWQAALRSVTYINSSQHPNTATRTISFVVNDGTAASNPATKDIIVVAVNTAPVAVDDAVTVQEDTPATGNVLTNDSDVEGNALTASLVTAPVNGTVVLNADGSLTYTPNANYHGLDSLVYQVCDNGTPSRCDTATTRFTIEAVNDAPVNTIPGSQTIGQNEPLVWNAGNGNLISIADVDAGGEGMRVTLSATNGLLTLSGTAGLSFGVGSGTDDATMTFDGTIADINAALNGLVFVPTRDYTGSASLQITTNDLGHLGTGEEKTDDDTIGITVIDGTNPVVTTVNVPTDGYYREGDVLSFTVNFSEQIHVNTQGGTPYLEVIIGSATVHATYQSGSGTDALMFNYIVQAVDQDLDGIALGSSLVLNGGTLLDAADNEALLPLNGVAPTDQVFVYSVRPTVTLSTTVGSPVHTAFTVTATFSEAVTGFTLDDLSIVHATSRDLQTADNITYTFLVTPTAGGAVQVAVPADVVVNRGDNGNLASNTLEVQYSRVITGITLEDSSFVYDGTAKSLAIKGVLPAGATVSYTNNSRTEVGTQEVTATISGANYEDLVLKANLTVTKATVSGVTLEDQSFVYDGTAKSLAIKGTLPAGATVSYTNNNRTEVGVQEVTATISGANYETLVLKATLQISPAERSIHFAELSEKTYGDGDFDIQATASSKETISYASNNTNVATISTAGRIHIIGAGETLITATVPENANYSNRPTVSRKLVVKKASQEIRFTALDEVDRDAGSIPLDVQASSALPVRLEVNDPQVATVSETTLNILRLGTVIITAYQEGDTNYEAADPVSIRVHVVDKEAKLPIKVHKALSPNGDGINDFLMIEGVKDYPDNRLVIVDRNGMQITEMKGYNNADVVFRGVGPGNNPIPPGTYYYLLEVKVNGNWQYEKGYFVVRY